MCITVNIWAATWQNQRNGMCAQRRLRSAWASAHSDQSLRSLHEEPLVAQLPIERTAKTLIRLGRCPDWPESSPGAQPHCWFCHEAAPLSTESIIVVSMVLSLFINCDSLVVTPLKIHHTLTWVCLLSAILWLRQSATDDTSDALMRSKIISTIFWWP